MDAADSRGAPRHCGWECAAQRGSTDGQSCCSTNRGVTGRLAPWAGEPGAKSALITEWGPLESNQRIPVSKEPGVSADRAQLWKGWREETVGNKKASVGL